MKLLFISSYDVSNKFYGAGQCTNRNYNSFCLLIGNNSVDVINIDDNTHLSFKNKVFKRINLIFGLYWGLSPKKISHIIFFSKKTGDASFGHTLCIFKFNLKQPACATR